MSNKRNVIVIMSDSMRRDHLGCYGNKWIKTPNIDKFASNATVFDHVYVEGLPTVSVRTSLFTGRYTLPFRGWQPLEEEDILLPEILWSEGCYSALISDTYHLHKPLMGFGRGFDFVQWIRGQESDPYVVDPNVKVDLTKHSKKDVEQVLGKKAFEQYLRNRAHWKSEEDHFCAQVVKAGMNWLEQQLAKSAKERFLLWLDIFDPHDPWDPRMNIMRCMRFQNMMVSQ